MSKSVLTLDKSQRKEMNVQFTNIDQGLLLFYISMGVVGIFATLLYIASKK